MKSVYGLMTNTGSGNEFLYDLGVWETEDSAAAYLENELPHSTGIWVEVLTVNDGVTDDLETPVDEMVTCSQCGVDYNAADILKIEELDVCLNCEPAYTENNRGASA